MSALLISFLIVFAILLLSEYFWRHKILRSEKLRKFVHILVGVFVAFWPWWLSWEQIQLASLAFMVVILVDRKLKIFHALNSVRRFTFGNLMFAAGIGASALLTTNKIFFMIAILHLALADGVAALAGRYYGNQNRYYHIFGQKKSLYGSLAFFITSLLIVGIGLMGIVENQEFDNYIPALLIIPATLTVLENISPNGMDNFIIPVVAIYMLNLLS